MMYKDMRHDLTILVASVQQSLKVDVGVCFWTEYHETVDLLLDHHVPSVY